MPLKVRFFPLPFAKQHRKSCKTYAGKLPMGSFPWWSIPSTWAITSRVSIFVSGCWWVGISLRRTQLRSDSCWKSCPNRWVPLRIVHFWPMDSHSRYHELPVPVTNFDPNAMSFDPNAVSFDPNAMSFDPKAATFYPKAAGFDPQAVSFDPKAVSFDPTATMFDPKVSWRRELPPSPAVCNV